MEFKKILEQTDRYDIVQWKFQGMPITFRLWKDGSQIVEIRVDEHFAKANGYKSVDDMAEKLFGGVPEWIRASPNGDFTFVGINPILYN